MPCARRGKSGTERPARSSSFGHVFLSCAMSISSHREPNPALNRTLRDKAAQRRLAPRYVSHER
jgi:hypothetical protein